MAHQSYVWTTSNPTPNTAGVPKKQLVNLTSHGFSAGNVLRMFNGAYTLAKSDTLADLQGSLGVIETVVDANNFVIVWDGQCAISGLSDDSVYYVSAYTGGLLSTVTGTSPTGAYNVVVTLNATGAIINPLIDSLPERAGTTAVRPVTAPPFSRYFNTTEGTWNTYVPGTGWIGAVATGG